jgi:type IV pilus assembly protein PilO
MAIGANMTQREQMMVGIAVVAFLLAGAFWYFPYQSNNERLTVIEQHVEALDKVNSKAQKEMAKGNVTELRAQADAYKQSLNVMRQLVPTNNEVPLLLDQVSTAARRANLDIGAVQPDSVIPGNEFDTYRYKVGLVGTYHELGRFFANVGALTRIVAPVDVKLQPANPAQQKRMRSASLIQADMEIRTYVARTAPLPPPGGGQ